MQTVFIKQGDQQHQITLHTRTEDFDPAYRAHLGELRAIAEDARLAADTYDVATTFAAEREATSYVESNGILSTAAEEMDGRMACQFLGHVGSVMAIIQDYQRSALSRSPYVVRQVGNA